MTIESTRNSMSIRRATQDDVQSLVHFNQQMAWETEQKKLDTAVLNEGVSAVVNYDDRGFYLVAEAHNQVIASLMVTFEWSDWRNGFFWWVQSVYVLPEFRRQGLYQQLYATVQELGANAGAIGFRLYVEKENQVAQKTYQSLGMTVCDYDMYEAMAAGSSAQK
ncbi:GNAT family N-acetyltransferase [uncultured Umboniibacter sp.]|uniref:GNAT family N-acetyltransferase n=1 Tax=uncultured Umboniibacter sp. TaxID=1798917 RepID=UPI002627D57C|nr:GNAT family N-acetyltransferase [uncultured Umboniibacter sp.]